MQRYLASINTGPISDAGLIELYSFVLGFVKREVARG